jgi:hypothetical protein
MLIVDFEVGAFDEVLDVLLVGEDAFVEKFQESWEETQLAGDHLVASFEVA